MPPERRRTTRFSPKGTARFRGDHTLQPGRITNLSRGGLQVATTRLASQDLLGRVVELELRLDGIHDEWLPIAGRVCRIDAAAVALEIVTAPATFGQLVDDRVMASHCHVQILSVVLVDATESRRAAVAEAFRVVGCAVVDASSALEAIVRLGEARFEPDLIVIADSVPSATADDLRRFVEREHPAARLVTVGDELVKPTGILQWLSSANPDGDMVARVRELLSRPPQA